MLTVHKWNTGKMWLAPIASLIMWGVSVLCFVYGLSFENDFVVFEKNLATLVALSLALSNTIIQLIGNGKVQSDSDWVFAGIWGASYVLGISSNTYALLQILGMDNPALEWAVSLSLGSIIEIAPEKLIMMWLREVAGRGKAQQPNQRPVQPVTFGHPISQKQHKYQPKHKPSHMGNQRTWPPEDVMRKIKQAASQEPSFFNVDEDDE